MKGKPITAAKHPPARSSAFTLTEVLTVMAIVGVLASLTVPSLCLSNLRQLAVAFQLYADDHADRVTPNRDGRNHPLGETWVQGWLGAPGPDATNVVFLRSGLLGPYVSGITIWKCPDTERVRFGETSQVRVRTVSINGFVGLPEESPVARTYRTTADFHPPGPADLLTFVEERAETINDGSFQLQWAFREDTPGDWLLRDQPATLHGWGGCCFR